MDDVVALLRGDLSTVGVVVVVLIAIITGKLIPKSHHLEVVTALREQLAEMRADRDVYRALAHGTTDSLDRLVDVATVHQLTQPTRNRPTFHPRNQPGGDDD